MARYLPVASPLMATKLVLTAFTLKISAAQIQQEKHSWYYFILLDDFTYYLLFPENTYANTVCFKLHHLAFTEVQTLTGTSAVAPVCVVVALRIL